MTSVVMKLAVHSAITTSQLIKVISQLHLIWLIEQQIIEGTNNSSGPEFIHDLFTMNVQRYAAFCKVIPEYCQLGEEDQIALFKGCITEASLLRSAQSYAEHPGNGGDATLTLKTGFEC